MEMLDVDTLDCGEQDVDITKGVEILRPRRKSRRMPLPATVLVRVGQRIYRRHTATPRTGVFRGAHHLTPKETW